MIKKYDFLVIGSGIAGMSFALKVAQKGKVAIMCKTQMEEANTHYAQGGVAAVTKPTDNFELSILANSVSKILSICLISAVSTTTKSVGPVIISVSSCP